MKAIILAAGMASRLRPLTNNTPKCLLKIVIVTGYLNNLIEDFVREQYPDVNVSFIHNNIYDSTNNIYSLWLARPKADGEEILLLDSDLLYDPEIIARVLDTPAENILTLIRHDLGEEEMKVVTDGGSEGNITEISKTCSPADAIGESLGIEKMGKSYTSALYKELEPMMNQEHLENVFYEKAFERLIPKGHTFKVLDVTDLFSCELDTVEDFQNAKEKIPQSLY